MPPFTSNDVGRPSHELVRIYQENAHLPLGNYTQVSNKVCTSKFTQLSLKEYCIARKMYCLSSHSSCSECPSMIKAAELVLEAGICPLYDVFK